MFFLPTLTMTLPIDRRHALSTLAGMTAAFALPAFAADLPAANGRGASDGAETKPYEILNPPIKGDFSRVRLLFSYDCPFCRNYHNGLVQWGASLPKPLSFEATPLITREGDALFNAVLGRLITKDVAPQVLQTYDYLMYMRLQGDPEMGTPPVSQLTVTDVLRTIVEAGADGKAVQAYLRGRGKGVENRVADHARLVRTYKLTSTPSVALAGRYVVTPDNAQGNPQQFLLLLNGIVSRIIQGAGSAV